jgi:hypothetical protein
VFQVQACVPFQARVILEFGFWGIWLFWYHAAWG